MVKVYKKFRISNYSFNDLIILSLAIAILFMHPLKMASSVLSFIDEFIVFTCLIVYVANILIKRNSITKTEFAIIFFFALFIIVGLISNIISGIIRSSSAIALDIISFSKFTIISLGGFYLFKNTKNITTIFAITVKIVHLLIITGFALAITNQIVDLGMRNEYRYGIYCFKFIYMSAGIFSWYCYLFLLILTIDLMQNPNKKTFFYIALHMLTWILTGRSRAFAFIAIYLVLAFILKMHNTHHKPMKIHLKYIITLGVLSLLVAWNQIVFYFTTETQARNILLRVGFNLSRDFFPFGAGFATFGTNASQVFYSPIYYMYGMSNIYGFTATDPKYLTDTFWPAVGGETGIIGIMIYAILLFCIFKHLYKKIVNSNLTSFIMIFVITTIFCSSVATSIFTQNVTIGIIFYICMIPSLQINKTKI